MSDVLTSKQRSYCMSQIKGSNTKPENRLRKALWSRGLRYRIKNKLPGKPDVVLPRFKIAVFVDGCFWHKCPEHFKSPKTNKDFWQKKIAENVERDKVNNKKLESIGWTVFRFWEHDIKNNLDECVLKIKDKMSSK